jgi:hypothetical protein
LGKLGVWGGLEVLLDPFDLRVPGYLILARSLELADSLDGVKDRAADERRPDIYGQRRQAAAPAIPPQLLRRHRGTPRTARPGVQGSKAALLPSMVVEEQTAA